MNLIIKSIESISDVAVAFLQATKDFRVFAFEGNMGAGKTTFIKSLCQQLGVTDIINSPTFSIINEYWLPDGNLIFHFDCYRIEYLAEAMDMGAEDYLYSGQYCFIEWPDRIAPLLPDGTLFVKIEELENGERQISF